MRFPMTAVSVLAISCGIFLAGPAYADILHVPGDFPTIQAAIDAGMDGDEVEVHPGTYFETINFLGKAIRAYSTDGPDVTIIDGTGLNNSVVKCVSGEGQDTVLEGFTITNGTGDGTVIPGSTVGGGMSVLSSSPTIVNCIFTGNSCSGGEGYGAGLFNDSGSPTITRCSFDSNTTQRIGGGIYTRNIAAFTAVANCLFSGNASTTDKGGAIGVYYSSNMTVTNCVFVNNLAPVTGGAMDVAANGSATITNCTFVGNDLHAIAKDGDGTVVVTNSILWGNTGEFQFTGPMTINYCNVQDGLPGGDTGEGNIDADPLFIDPDSENLRLQDGSPCIDAGDSGAIPLPTDLDDNPRGVDDPSTPDSGITVFGLTVDMGAYEFQVDQCPADFNDDGDVDAKDLAQLLGSWGPCK